MGKIIGDGGRTSTPVVCSLFQDSGRFVRLGSRSPPTYERYSNRSFRFTFRDGGLRVHGSRASAITRTLERARAPLRRTRVRSANAPRGATTAIFARSRRATSTSVRRRVIRRGCAHSMMTRARARGRRARAMCATHDARRRGIGVVLVSVVLASVATAQRWVSYE